MELGRRKGLELSGLVNVDVPNNVWGDPGRVRQILLNLLSNAIKFTQKGSVETTVQLDRIDGNTAWIRIAVRDTGIGITLHDQSKLFQSFTQADASMTRRFGGTGLGLAISRKLTELMGGTIGAVSAPDEGSTFWFLIPLEVSSQPVLTPAVVPSVLAQEMTGTPAHVLLAEDNPTNQRVATLLLQRLHCRVDVVSNGAEAVEASSRVPYDLILMDCQMPELDGLAATRKIRSIQRERGRTPIVALTANALDGERERCLEAGMDDYVVKPVGLAVLASVVRKWGLNQSQAVIEPDRCRQSAGSTH
jgi:CheY-like chemotaxis protein